MRGSYRKAWVAFLALASAAYVWIYGVRLWPRIGIGPADFDYYLLAGRAIVEGASPFAASNFDYPPLLPFLAAPFSMLSRLAATRLWFVLGHVFIAFAAWWSCRGIRRSPSAALAVALTWAAAGSLAVSLREGQINNLLLALLCLVLWPPEGAPTVAAAALGTAAALKLWPAILWLSDLSARRWRRIAVGVAHFAALVALPAIVIAARLRGPIWPQRSTYWLGTPAFLNGSLPGFVLRLMDPMTRDAPLPRNWVMGNQTALLRLPSSHSLASAGVSLLAFALGLAWLYRGSDRGRFAGGTARLGAALISLTLLAAPISWPHYQVFQLPGAARLGLELEQRRRWRSLSVLILAFLVANWTEAVVMGPYLAAYGTSGQAPGLAWLLSTLPVASGACLFLLHLRALNARPEADDVKNGS